MMGRTNEIAPLANTGDNYARSGLTFRRNIPTFHDEMEGVHDVVVHGQGIQVVEDVGVKSAPLHGVHDAVENGFGARDASEMGGRINSLRGENDVGKKEIGVQVATAHGKKIAGEKTTSQREAITRGRHIDVTTIPIA
jgi:hypothetical protein